MKSLVPILYTGFTFAERWQSRRGRAAGWSLLQQRCAAIKKFFSLNHDFSFTLRTLKILNATFVLIATVRTK